MPTIKYENMYMATQGTISEEIKYFHGNSIMICNRAHMFNTLFQMILIFFPAVFANILGISIHYDHIFPPRNILEHCYHKWKQIGFAAQICGRKLPQYIYPTPGEGDRGHHSVKCSSMLLQDVISHVTHTRVFYHCVCFAIYERVIHSPFFGVASLMIVQSYKPSEIL